MKPQRTVVVFAVLCCGMRVGAAQEPTHKPISVVEDWSTHQVVFGEDVPRPLWGTVLKDSRFWQQYYRRHIALPLSSFCPEEEAGRAEVRCRNLLPGRWRVAGASSQRDWSVSLGGGSGGPISQPAKFAYDVTSGPSCTNDFVVTGINVAGSSTQANIIGFNNLYVNSSGTGLCSGTAPKVAFSYFVGTGLVPSSPVVSLDGKKVAFIENISTTSSILHIVTFQTSAGNGTSATAPAVPGTGNTAVDTQVSFTASSSTAPFIDYDHDVAYVTTNGSASVVHKVAAVFRGVPVETTTGGWPATIPSNPSISSPVYDFTSKHLFVEDATGDLDYVDDSVNPAVVHSGTFSIASNGINATPVVVDSSRSLVYAFANNPNGTNALIAQANTSLGSGSLVTVNVGTGMSNVLRQVDFNNAYYSGGTFSSAFMYVVGNDSSAAQRPALFNVGFSNSSFVLKTTTANGPLALSTGFTTGIYASPLTEFYNSTTSTDYMFVGVSGSCSGSISGGCMRSWNISTFPTTANVNNVILAASGGTGRATVDNYSTSAGTSSIYYTTLTGNTIVKATQAGLQ